MNKITLSAIIANGGATLNRNGEAVNFSRGYQVSRKDCYKITVENVGEILKRVNEILKRLDNGDFCGLWVDGGEIYIDISEHINSRKKALRVGHCRKQISIFEWATGECLSC